MYYLLNFEITLITYNEAKRLLDKFPDFIKYIGCAELGWDFLLGTDDLLKLEQAINIIREYKGEKSISLPELKISLGSNCVSMDSFKIYVYSSEKEAKDSWFPIAFW